ncbi:MAG: DUF1376 domain-containing protein [Proteobacteria bacterium]|nr:DUF1376 domain-containing protein [Pseudomonadota bacterium]
MAPKITPPKGLLVDIAAWQAEVMALPAPAIACGSLLLLKMHLWRIGPIPDDDVALARITATSPAEWKKLRKALEPLFIVKYGEWLREDWSDELEAAYEAVNKARQKSQKGHAARWGGRASGNATGNASGMPAGMLNIKAPLDQQPQPKPNPKTPKPGTNNFQPDFEADVEIAEAALGIGGAA